LSKNRNFATMSISEQLKNFLAKGKLSKEDQAVRRLAYILSVQAEIEGMKAQNSINEFRNYPPRFNFEDFELKAVELKRIATWKA